MDRAGNRAGPLTNDELKKVLLAVVARESQNAACNSLPGRNPNTIRRAYRVLAVFETRRQTHLEDDAASLIAESTGYSTSITYVQKTFLTWRLLANEASVVAGDPGDELPRPTMNSRISAETLPAVGHQADLMKEVQRLKSSAIRDSKTVLRPTNGIALMLHDALRQHTTQPGLPDLLDNLESARTDVLRAEEYSLRRISLYTARIASNSGREFDTSYWANHLMESFDQRVRFDGLIKAEHREYRHEPDSADPGKVRSNWGGYQLTHDPVLSELAPVIETAHREFRKWGEDNELTGLKKVRDVLNQAKNLLVESLDHLIIRRAVPGLCEFCVTK